MQILKKYIFFSLLFLVSQSTYCQDKLYLKNGDLIACKINHIEENTINYQDTLANSIEHSILKTDVLIAEYKTGEIYIFSKNNLNTSPETAIESRQERQDRKMKEWKAKEQKMPNGILGFYPVQLFGGRLTASYERLVSNKNIGILIPFSLTYDMFNALNSASTSTASSPTGTTSSASGNRPTRSGFGAIIGMDINYYYDLKSELKYFFGPRFRYGTAMTFGGIEYLSFQLQNGIMKSKGTKFTNSLSIGFGFFKLSKKYSAYPNYESNQVYPMGSITWRLGFRL